MTKKGAIPSRVGKRGTVVIPSELRARYGFEEGSMIVAEPTPEGVLLRPAVTLPVQVYSDEKIAEFLLNNTVTPEGYDWACEEVRKLGLDPAKIPHDKPTPRLR